MDLVICLTEIHIYHLQSALPRSIWSCKITIYGYTDSRVVSYMKNCVSTAFSGIQIAAYVAARAQEMEAMDQLVATGSRNNQAAQGVPLYMRRRAASHNVKRLPRRLRQKALSQQVKSYLEKLLKWSSSNLEERFCMCTNWLFTFCLKIATLIATCDTLRSSAVVQRMRFRTDAVFGAQVFFL